MSLPPLLLAGSPLGLNAAWRWVLPGSGGAEEKRAAWRSSSASACIAPGVACACGDSIWARRKRVETQGLPIWYRRRPEDATAHTRTQCTSASGDSAAHKHPPFCLLHAVPRRRLRHCCCSDLRLRPWSVPGTGGVDRKCGRFVGARPSIALMERLVHDFVTCDKMENRSPITGARGPMRASRLSDASITRLFVPEQTVG